MRIVWKEAVVAKLRCYSAIVWEGLVNIMKFSVWLSNLRAGDLNPRPTDYEPLFTHVAAKFGLMLMRKVLYRRVGYAISINDV